MNTEAWGPGTVLMVLSALAVIVVGGIAVLTTNNLEFSEWIDALTVIGGATALGKGLAFIGSPKSG